MTNIKRTPAMGRVFRVGTGIYRIENQGYVPKCPGQQEVQVYISQTFCFSETHEK